MYSAFRQFTGDIEGSKRPPQGCMFDVTLLIAERGKFIVKTGDTLAKIAELEREALLLTILSPYQPLVPAFVSRQEDLFLFTYLGGRSLAELAHAPEQGSNKQALAREYGRGLRVIHDTLRPRMRLSPDWLGEALSQSGYEQDTSNPTGNADGHSAHAGRSFADLLLDVTKEKADYPEVLRFCHGDWCLPNVLANDGVFCGSIDWSNGGFKDYRFDLATGLWSLRRNGLTGFEGEFLAAYGYNGGSETLSFFEAVYALASRSA